MRLFKNDIGEPDYTSKNLSFIRYAALLKKEGVENHSFCLTLLNKALKEVDPFNPNLTYHEQAAIYIECVNNPWYYFREIVRVPDAKGDLTFLKANKLSIPMLWLYYNSVSSIIVGMRQLGKSTPVEALLARLFWTSTNHKVGTVFSQQSLKEAFINNMKYAITTLPIWDSPGMKDRVSFSSNCQTNRMLSNLLYTYFISNKSRFNPRMFVGHTFDLFYIPDACDSDYILDIISTLLPSMNVVDDSVFIITTRPQVLKKYSPKELFYRRGIKDNPTWDNSIFDMKDKASLKELMGDNKFMVIQASYRDVGYTDDWLTKTIKDSMADEYTIKSEFMNEYMTEEEYVSKHNQSSN